MAGKTTQASLQGSGLGVYKGSGPGVYFGLRLVRKSVGSRSNVSGVPKETLRLCPLKGACTYSWANSQHFDGKSFT